MTITEKGDTCINIEGEDFVVTNPLDYYNNNSVVFVNDVDQMNVVHQMLNEKYTFTFKDWFYSNNFIGVNLTNRYELGYDAFVVTVIEKEITDDNEARMLAKDDILNTYLMEYLHTRKIKI